MTEPKKTGRFAKGNPGKPKGAVSKLPAEVRAMVIQALDKAGGVDYLVECAQDPRARSAFLTLVGKVIPTQITGEGDGPLTTVHRIELVGVAPK